MDSNASSDKELIWETDAAACDASFEISSATTANPLPDSPALAASIAAFNASKLVFSEILEITSEN